MSRTNAERRQDMSSSPIQRTSQQTPKASSSKRSTPVDKENVVYDSQQRYLLKQQQQHQNNPHTDDIVKSPQKWMNGPLSYKTTMTTTQPSFQQSLDLRMRRSQPTNTNGALFHQDASDVFAVGSDADESSSEQDLPFGPIHSSSSSSLDQMEEERRRRCSDPVAAFLHRQVLDQENHASSSLPLQEMTNNWRDTHGSNAAAATTTAPMRPKPIWPSAILP